MARLQLAQRALDWRAFSDIEDSIQSVEKKKKLIRGGVRKHERAVCDSIAVCTVLDSSV
jgi:hypothetical protein